MTLLGKLRKALARVTDHEKIDTGILIFATTSEVISAEKILKEDHFTIRVMGPPPEVQTGCDLVIEFSLMEGLSIVRTLDQKGISPISVVPVSSPLLKPVDLFNVKDFGEWLMVRAANMKITINKSDLRIVNISGGGCPDIPYLAQEMMGKTLSETPQPRDLGQTLCAYALQLAYEELVKKCSP